MLTHTNCRARSSGKAIHRASQPVLRLIHLLTCPHFCLSPNQHNAFIHMMQHALYTSRAHTQHDVLAHIGLTPFEALCSVVGHLTQLTNDVCTLSNGYTHDILMVDCAGTLLWHHSSAKTRPIYTAIHRDAIAKPISSARSPPAAVPSHSQP